MTSRRKLEEEIARTKEPIVRKQLQELLDNRKQRRDKKVKDAKKIGASLLHEINESEPHFREMVVRFLIFIAISLIFIFLLDFLEWVF